jgi:hypothetical protein
VFVKKTGNCEYLYLVENAREGGCHARVVKALGRRDELDALMASAARHSRRSIVLSSLYRGELAELQRVSISAHFGVWPPVAEHRPSRCYRRIAG